MVAAPIRCRVLVVDDDPWMLRSLRRLLEAEFDVDTAPDIETGLAVMAKTPPDLLISDLNIGHERGEDLLATVRRDYPSVFRIALSAAGPPRLKALIDDELAQAVIDKGMLDSAALMKLLRAECGKRGASKAAAQDGDVVDPTPH